MPTTIALDAFGGDDCPNAEVDAAIRAARDGMPVILVGDREKLAAALARRGVHLDSEGQAPGAPLRVHHASEVITMADTPSKVVRTRTDASMLVCFDLVKQGKAQAVVSAGNSGAMLACGLSLSEALPIANRAGGIAVGKFGNATLTFEELFE